MGRWVGGRWGGGEEVVYLKDMHYQRLLTKLEKLGRILDQGYQQWMKSLTTRTGRQTDAQPLLPKELTITAGFMHLWEGK